MANAVPDEENPMLIHKSDQDPNYIDLYGRNIPIDPSTIPLHKQSTVDTVIDKVASMIGPDPSPHIVTKIKIDSEGTPSRGWLDRISAFFGFSGTF